VRLFGGKDPAASIPPDYLAVLRTDYGASAANKHATKRLAESAAALRSELRTCEQLELIVDSSGRASGIVAVTDSRLIWLSRGQVRAQFDRSDVHSVTTTPRATAGYELVFRRRSGSILGPTFEPWRLAHANSLRRAVAPNAASNVTLAPEDIVERAIGRGH
jgi:hypothetical protein